MGRLYLFGIVLILANLFYHAEGGLSDYGGDVSQYMDLLKGSSAFSFKPGADEDEDADNSPTGFGDVFGDDDDEMSDDELSEMERRGLLGMGPDDDDDILDEESEAPEESEAGEKSPGSDFGGDYGDYLKLLEGKSALGFNPQADPVADNQDLQTDVFGGGMSGKFWSMYKGKSSFDSFDEKDEDLIEEMGIDDTRQTEEMDQPEDRPNMKKEISKKNNTVTIVYKPNKEVMSKIYSSIEKALMQKDKSKLNKILKDLDPKKILEITSKLGKSRRIARGFPGFPGMKRSARGFPGFGGRSARGFPGFGGRSARGFPGFGGRSARGFPGFGGRSARGFPGFGGRSARGFPGFGGRSARGFPGFGGRSARGFPGFPGRSVRGFPGFPGKRDDSYAKYMGGSGGGFPGASGSYPGASGSYPGSGGSGASGASGSGGSSGSGQQQQRDVAEHEDDYSGNRRGMNSDMLDDTEAYAGEMEKEDQSRMISAKRELVDFVKRFSDNVPDPIGTNKGLTMNYRNMTLFGISDISVCGPVKKYFGSKWKADLCMPRMSATVNCVAGPGVPFKGRVSAILAQPRIEIMFKEMSPSQGGGIHILSLRSKPKHAKFVPTYDSSIPLNPWSKVSMSGYMVARVKKNLPKIMDKILLKLMHIVERLDKD